jgi:ribonucleoside-triphosphate reductase
MDIRLNTGRDFDFAIDNLRRKYGESFEYLNGLHPTQLNFSNFIDAFIDKNVADVTIDGNANAHHKDVVSLEAEKDKSIDKLFAANKIFYEMEKKYGQQTAREWLETEWTGGFYLHDFPSATLKPYCYAYDLDRLAREGLFFIENYNYKPAQHLTTWFDDVIEYISYMSNRTSGAVGLPNVLIWAFYFWKKDTETGYCIKNPEYHIRQNFQKFIHRLNQPFMRVDQSAFTNVSIFDRYYLEELFGGLEFPDGSMAIDYIDEILNLEKIYMEVTSEVRNENMFTFPVLTYSLLYEYKNEKFADAEFAR